MCLPKLGEYEGKIKAGKCIENNLIHDFLRTSWAVTSSSMPPFKSPSS